MVILNLKIKQNFFKQNGFLFWLEQTQIQKLQLEKHLQHLLLMVILLELLLAKKFNI